MEEAVQQFTVEEVKQMLFDEQVSGDDAGILLAIAYLESKFKHGIDGDTDPNDKGLWQINPPQYFKGQEPDNMVKNFYAEQGEVLSLDEFTNKVKYDIDYATKFAVHIMNYRRKNPKSYGPDPFDAWTTYKEYIKPNMKNLAADQELIFKDALDAEITEAIGYIKNYNDIDFADTTPTTSSTTTSSTTTVPPTTATTMPKDTSIDTTSRSQGITNMFGQPTVDDFKSKTRAQVIQLLEASVNEQRGRKNLPKISNDVNVNTDYAQLSDDQKTVLDVLRGFYGSD
jgi:hypothetical protein